MFKMFEGFAQHNILNIINNKNILNYFLSV